MIAPLRAVMAMPGAHCDADNEAMNTAELSDHTGMHDMMSMADMEMVNMEMDNMEQPSSEMMQNCCCCDGNGCLSDCDMGMSVSLFFQAPSYSPKVTHVAVVASLTINLVSREDTPPFRPPLAIHR